MERSRTLAATGVARLEDSTDVAALLVARRPLTQDVAERFNVETLTACG